MLDAGTSAATITSYSISGATWAPTQIITNAIDFFSIDSTGDKILVATPAATKVFPIGGGGATTIDTKDITYQFGYLNRAGTTVFYQNSGALYTAVVSSTPNPQPIQAANVTSVRGVSPNEQYILYNSTWDSDNFLSDLYLTATTASATATTLVSTITGGLFGATTGDNFTADSKFVVWAENVNTNSGLGDFYSMPIAGGTPAKITTGLWANFAATGSKQLYVDNCPKCTDFSEPGNQPSNINVIDLSAPTPTPNVLVTMADVPQTFPFQPLYLNRPTNDRFTYTFSQNPPTASGNPPLGGNGLYAVTGW
jgi:hypothetical protein